MTIHIPMLESEETALNQSSSSSSPYAIYVAISIGIVLSVGAIPILIVLILRVRRKDEHVENPHKAAVLHLRRFRTPTGGWHGTYRMGKRTKGDHCGEEKSISIEEELQEIGDGIVVDPNLFLHKHYKPPSSDGDGNSSVESFHNNNSGDRDNINYIHMKYALGLVGSHHSNSEKEVMKATDDMAMTNSEHAMSPAYYAGAVANLDGDAGLSSLLTLPNGDRSDSDDEDDEESLRESSFRADVDTI